MTEGLAETLIAGYEAAPPPPLPVRQNYHRGSAIPSTVVPRSLKTAPNLGSTTGFWGEAVVSEVPLYEVVPLPLWWLCRTEGGGEGSESGE